MPLPERLSKFTFLHRETFRTALKAFENDNIAYEQHMPLHK